MTSTKKRIIALIFSVILTLSLSLPAFAANITATQAENIALKHSGYTRSDVVFRKTTLEKDDGRYMYEVDFTVVSGNYLYEYDYEINASSGKIIEADKDKEYFIPANVTGLKASKITKTSARLSWDKVRGADGYIIYKYTKASGYKQVAKTRSTYCNISSLKTGKTYKYCVKAYIFEDGRTGLSPKYTSVKVRTKTAAPGSVAVSSPKAGTVKVSFSKVTGAEKYVIQLSNSSTFSSVLKSKTVTGTSASFTSLKKGTKVYARVYACNASGVKSAASAVKSVKVK